MASIAQFLNAWQKVNTDKAIDEAIEATQSEVLKLNKEQLMRGENKFGVKNARYKNPKYREKKMAMNNLAGGRVDLNLTGALHKEMFTDVRPDIIVLSSTDWKAPFVFNRYPLALGLSDDSKKTYTITLRPVVISNIKKQLNGR